ncbi:MAG TPA: hypothetical protein EYG80_07810 [Flavobacteriaceae bacterium]|nr:hypothetical protein [Flavobacteriaceae bacterium]
MSIENINNTDVKELLRASLEEIKNIENITTNFLGATSPASPYMSRYAIIKACSSIERSFKIIIADFLLLHTTNESLSNFINNSIRHTSTNPKYETIVNVLKGIDKNLGDTFKIKVKEIEDFERVKTSLNSLVNERNKLAHGGSPTSTSGDVIKYFKDAIFILIALENVCS